MLDHPLFISPSIASLAYWVSPRYVPSLIAVAVAPHDLRATFLPSTSLLNKVDVNEAEIGSECGLKYKGNEDIKIGDIFEVYKEEKF